MTLSASIKHRAPGRIRLQLAEDDYSKVRLHDAVQALRRSPNLRRVQGNPVTRTILLEAENENDLQTALDEVSVARVIDLNPHPTPPAHDSLRANWNSMTNKADRFLKDVSEDRVDLRTGLGLVLAVLGIGQMTRGKFLPAGMTLLMYAAGVMEASESKKKR